MVRPGALSTQQHNMAHSVAGKAAGDTEEQDKEGDNRGEAYADVVRGKNDKYRSWNELAK